jgi:hypothetical protein
VSGTDRDEQAAGYVGTYVWTDAYGREGAVDVHADPATDPPVLALAGDDPAGVVAAVGRDGRPVWSPEAMRATGLDTTAARNDLIEIIRQTYLRLSVAR